MIPVCVPTLGEAEKEYVDECLETNWISAMGEYVNQFEDEFAEYTNSKYGISTTSGTTALHLALEAIGVEEGDEVILPTFTMGATALAVVYCGAKPVLVDSNPRTGNMNPEQIRDAITDRTKAILPVHIYGHPCDMDSILQVADEHDLYVVEDAAEAHGAEYKGRKVGSLGDVGCFSFYANKMITTGEGGMVVTDDDEIAERAEWLKSLAYSAEERFVHTAIGFNYRMTNVQAAIGVGQLEKMDEFVAMRRKNASLYNEALTHVNGIETPPEKSWAKNVYWMYSVVVTDEFGLSRDELMAELDECGVETRPFFVPMHEQPIFLEQGWYEDDEHPVAEELARKGLYLPSSSHLSEEEIQHVTTAIREIADRQR